MPGNLQATFLLSRAQRAGSKGNHEKAFSTFEEAIKNHPQHAGLHLQYGLALLNHLDFVNAQKEFELAKKMASQNPVIPMFLGISSLAQDKYGEALNYLNAASSLSTHNRLCHAFKGLAMLHMGKNKEGSSALLNNFASGNPVLESMVFYYCEKTCMTRQINSLELFEESLSPLENLSPETKKPFSVLSLALALAERLDSGLNSVLTQMEKLFRKKKDAFSTHFTEGMNHFQDRNYRQAKNELEKCARLDHRPPDHEGVQLAEALYWLKSYGPLSHLLKKYFPDNYDRDAEIMLMRAKIAIHEGQFKTAEALLKGIPLEEGLQFWQAYLKGLISLRLGNDSEAKASFRAAAGYLGLLSTRTYFAKIAAI